MKKIYGFILWLIVFMPIMTVVYLALYDEIEHMPKGYWYYMKEGLKSLTS